jgi:hypothetical protein
MMEYMNGVTDKPEWYSKITNEEITSDMIKAGLATEEMSEKMLDWVSYL